MLQSVSKYFIFFVFSALLASSSFGQEGLHFTGHFVDEEEKIQVVGEFKNLHQEWKVDHKGNQTKIPTKKIKEIRKIDEFIFIVTTRDHREFKVEGKLCDFVIDSPGYCQDQHLKYTYYDKINEKYSEDAIHHKNINKIVFDEDYGEIRRCPKGGRTFPPDYLFCPFHKNTNLELVRVGEGQ